MRAITLVTTLLVLVAPATGQLDVPDDRSEPKLEAPSRGYVAPRRRKRAQGGLDVGDPKGPAAADPVAARPKAAPVEPPAPPSGPGALLDRLVSVEDPADPLIAQAAMELLGLGEAGLSAGRAALYGDGAGLVMCGAEVLLSAGDATSRDQVAARLLEQLPSRAVVPLVDLLTARDPMRASPELFCRMLDHPQTRARTVAASWLEGRVGVEHLHLLATRLRSKRSDTRAITLELISGLEDPAVQHLLLDRLSDPVAKVARRAAQLLASDNDADVALVEAAFPALQSQRRAAYARIAIAEQEDRRGRALVDTRYAELLLPELKSEDPLQRGAAAVLLAGIGFREERSRGLEWLDREVPHELVRQLTGEVFHRDFSALVEPAQRRLELLSGRSFGRDAEAWRAWWVGINDDFRARRAFIEVSPQEVAGLEVRVKLGPPSHLAVRFLGPDASEVSSDTWPSVGRTVYLTAAGAADLLAHLRAEGVLSAERIPSTRVELGGAARELEVRVAGQAKRFAQSAHLRGEPDAWFERLSRLLANLEQDNRWQRFPGAVSLDEDPRAFFLLEFEWWAGEEREEARQARLKALVLEDLKLRQIFERGHGLGELERLAQHAELGPQDFRALLSLLADERYYGDRIARLTDLARQAAAGPQGRMLDVALATQLVEVLAAGFGGEATSEVVSVLEVSQPELTRSMASDDRPLLRALAAAGMARRGEPADLELLTGLLSDSDSNVEAAAVLAHGENGLRSADDELLIRARISEPRVKSAALRAIGRLGMEGALDVLVAALSDPHQGLQIAAAEGIADLADPSSASLLTSLLGRGSRSPLFAPAQRGLRALGADAHVALLHVAGSAAATSRRDALLLLAEDLVPEAVPALISLLHVSPSDSRVARELATLTCIDFRERDDPAASWSAWWLTVVQDDPLAWFRAACERRGIRAPSGEEFEGEGTLDARLLLAEFLDHSDNHMVERARRELSSLLGADLATPPGRGALREAWLDELKLRLLTQEEGEER